MHIVALTTCHNRRDLTLASLGDLHTQDLPANVSLSITIVDDGSTDGTAEAVRDSYPGVEIIKGDGNLYWAGGMRHGWEKSVQHQKFDALFVFNDDIRLNKNALNELIDTNRYVRKHYGPLNVISGAFTDLNGGIITYGGFRRSSIWHPLRFEIVTPTGVPFQIDTLNMNGALVSSEALHKVGFLARYFRHGGADLEFGLKLRKTGGSVWLTPSTIGKCDRQLTEFKPTDQRLSFREQYQCITGVKRLWPSERAHFFHDHAGLFWPLLWSGPYIRILISTIYGLLRKKS
jgi:GT2 family glycosyltransferase